MNGAAAQAPPWGSGEPVLMGILNVTPDSFSDGGRHAGVAAAVAGAEAMARAGAGIIDIGGESTRPGFTPVDGATEWGRIGPVLEALRGRLGVPVSVDTTKAAVARRALAAGAGIVNDIWGLQADPAMADAVAEAGAAVVVMHNRQAVDPALDVVDDLLRFFENALDRARRAGVPEGHVALDPGVGFGKTPAQQVEAVRAIPRLLAAFGRPVLVGLSRKSMLGHITGSAPADRLPDTIGANLAAFALGASLFRVHDVAAHAAAFAVFRTFGAGAAS